MSGFLDFLTQLAARPGWFLDNLEQFKGDDKFLATVMILLLLWLFSAFASFSFANSAGKNGKVHFWIGLLLPVLYPLILFVIMLCVKASAVSKAKQMTKKMEQERDEIEAEKRRIDSTPNKDNFSKLRASSDNASAVAQFLIELADGPSLHVAKILEAQDTLAVFELEAKEGEEPRVLRMPYTKMTRIERLKQ